MKLNTKVYMIVLTGNKKDEKVGKMISITTIGKTWNSVMGKLMRDYTTLRTEYKFEEIELVFHFQLKTRSSTLTQGIPHLIFQAELEERMLELELEKALPKE